jgi:hypothetical protein
MLYLVIQAGGFTQIFGWVDERLCAVCETHERTSHSFITGWTFLRQKHIAAICIDTVLPFEQYAQNATV